MSKDNRNFLKLQPDKRTEELKVINTENEGIGTFLAKFIYKYYLIVLIFFIYLDYSIFTNVFDLESGYFYMLLTSSFSSSSGFIITYILMPIIIIITFFLSGSLSLKISTTLKKRYIKRIEQLFLNKLIKKVNYLKKTIGLFVFAFILSFLNFCFFIILLFIAEQIENFTLLSSFGLLLLIFIFIKGLFGFIYLLCLNINNKFDIYMYEFIIFLSFACMLALYAVLENKVYFLILNFYYLYHLFSHLYYLMQNDNNKLESHSKKYRKLNFNIVFLFIVGIFIYLDHMNVKTWSKPIKVDFEKKAFKDLSINLLFNKGLLLNNKNIIEINIPTTYLKHIDSSSVSYFNKTSKVIEESFLIYKIGDDTKYLNISNNLKLYFKSLEKRTILFLIEEKRFANKKGSEYILIELNDYETKKLLK